MANNGRFEYTIGFKTDDNGLKQARKALQELQNMTTKTPGFENMSAELGMAKTAAAELESALTRSFNVKLKTTDVSKLRTELQKLDLQQIYKDLSAVGPKGEEVFNRMATQAMKTNLQIKQGNTLLERFGRTLYRNIEWMLAGNLVNTITGVFQKAYGFTKNLDSSLNDIRIVTGKSADEMARFGEEAQKTAAALGKGTTDITNASLIFYQQGLDTAEVNTRTEVATKLANVTKQSTDVTADQLTAVWNGYKATNDELERYADIMTAVAASTASSSSELSSAISKVASVANTTGVDMEQLTAMMSTVISVTRESPETVGTAFKTIFARINDLVEDGTDEFGVSLGRVSSHLQAMGIEILNQDGSLKDLGDTLSDVGNRWNEYSREQQIAIAEQIGGKRQWNQVIALFDNWDKYASALDVAKNSTGELQRQQDIYAESTAYHLQQIKTAWEGVYGQMMSSDDIIKVADFFTEVLKKVEAFLEDIGGIGPVLQMVAGYMLQAFGPKIGQHMANTINNLRIMKDNATQIAAQKDLTRILGSVEDNELMQTLVKQHQQILKYKNLMTEADRQEYEEYLDQTVALKTKEDQLKEEIRLTEQALNGRKALTEEYQKAGRDVDSANFPMETVESTKQFAQDFLKNKTVDTGDDSLTKLGTATIDVDEGAASARITEIQGWIDKLKEYQTTLPNQSGVYQQVSKEIDKLSSALEKVSIDFDKATESGSMNRGSLTTHENQVRKAATALLQYGSQADEINQILQQLTAEEGKSTQFFQDNSQVLEKSQANLEKYTLAVTTLERQQVLTTEQANKLRNELALLGKDETSLEQYTAGIRRVDSQLVTFVKQAITDMDRIQQSANDHLNIQLQNTQNGLEAWGNSFDQLINRLSTGSFFNNITQLANLTSQLSMTFTQLSNIGNIINDENLKDSEKMSKIMSSLAFTAPMVINLIKTITQTLIGSTVAKQKDNIESAKSNLLIAQKDTLEKKNFLTKKKQIAAEADHNAILKDKNATLAYGKWLEADFAFRNAQAEGALTGRIVAEEAAARAALEKASAEYKDAEATAAAAAVDEVAAGKALDRAKANEVAAKTALQDAGGAKGFFSSISSGSLIVAAIVAALAALVYGIKKVKEAEEEATEATKKSIEQAQRLVESVQENRKQIELLIDKYHEFDSVWEAFYKGRKSIDDARKATEEFLEVLGLLDDPKYERELRIAAYTGDYTSIVENARKEYQRRQKEAVNSYTDEISGYETDLEGQASLTSKEMGNGYFRYHAGENSGMMKTLKRMGIGEITRTWYDDGDYGYEFNFDNLTAEDLYQLSLLSRQIEEWKNSTNDTEVRTAQKLDQILQQSASTISLIQQTFLDQQLKQSALDFEPLARGTQQEQELEIVNRQNETLNKARRAYWEKFGKTMSQEQQEQFKQDYLDNIVKLFPEYSDIVNNIQGPLQDTQKAINNSFKDYWRDHGGLNGETGAALKDLTTEEVQFIQTELQRVGSDLSKIDWERATKDEELMSRLLQRVKAQKEFTQDDIDLLNQYEKEVYKVSTALTQDFTALGDSFDALNKRIEKGSLSDRNLSKNKEYQGLMADEVQQAVLTASGNDSKVQDAINTLNSDVSVGSKRWQEAWKVYGEAIKNAGIESALQDAEAAIEEFNKTDINGNVAIHADAKEYADTMDDILAADYSIDVEVHSRIDSSVDAIKSDLKDVSELVGKIDDGFTLSTSELDDFADKMPSVLDNMQVLSDGTIQLSQTAVEEAKKSAIEEANARIDSQVQVIEAQKAVLEHKKQTVEEMIKIATKMADKEYKTSKDLTDAENKLDGFAKDIKVDNELQAAIAEGNVHEDELVALSKFYSAGLKQAQEYVDKRDNIILNRKGLDSTENPWTVSSFKEDAGYEFKEVARYIRGRGRIAVFDDESLDNEKKLGEALLDMLNEQLDDYQNSIDEYQSSIDILNSYKKNYSSIWESIGKSKDKSTSSTKDATTAEAQLLEILNEEIDAYHDINIEIKQLETQLSRLQKQQSKLTGDALLKNLQEQLDILEKQNDAYLRKYDIMSMETAAVRTSLTDQGVDFNSDGTISNYAAIIQQKMQYVQDLQSQYNNMSKEEQDGFKDTVEQAKKDYENFKKAITDYDSLITEKIPELQDKIQEISDKEIEIQISKAQMKVQAVLDDQDLKRTEIEFKKKLARLKDDDILGNLTVNLEVMATYTADNGSLIALQQEVDRLTQVKADMDAGIFFSSEYGDNRAKLEEDLKAYSDQLRQQKEAVIGLRDAIQDAYVSALDQVNEKLDEQKEKYQQISDMLEKQINLYQIRFGDNTFDAISGLMEHQTDLAQKQYNVSLKQLDIFKKEYEKLLEQDPNEELEITQQAKKHFEEANTKVYEDLVSLFEARQKQYENAVKAFFEIFNRQLTGGKDLDYVKDSWDRLNADAEDYYDAVNGAYEINKLRNQIEKDINKSTDPNVQRQLTNFLNQQVAALEKKDKLSKYDLERANAMYDLEVKRATFQEAQQNKSKMRLRRDSQGNYSYQFVSDEQQVADSIQELAEAQNKLYNVDSSALKNSLDKVLKIQQEHQDAMIDTTGKTDEEIKEINDYYNKKQQEAVAEYWEIRNNLMESGLDAYAQKMGMTTDEVKRLTTEQKDAIMSDLVPAWNSAAATMVENMGGPDGIAAMFASTYDSLSQIRQDYFDDLDDYADAAGVDLENIQTAADATIDMMSSLMDSTDKVVDSLENMLDKVLNVINALTGTPQDMKSALEDLMKTLKPLTDLFPQYINTARQAVDAAQQTQQAVNNGGDNNINNSNNNNGGGNNNSTNNVNNNPTADFSAVSADRDDWGEGNFPKIGDKVIYLGDDYYYDSWGGGPSGNRGAGENKTVEVENVSPNSPYPIAVKSTDSAYGWLKKHQIAKMAKGGYTGDWTNNGGKLGILHEKELILNANRTKNLFEAFDSLTNPNKIVQNLMSGLEIMLKQQHFSFLKSRAEQATNEIPTERNTVINANFPGVHAAVEIEKALNDLINLSTQQAFSTLR